MTAVVAKKRYSPEEYYALERLAEYKSDYYNGEIFAMSGGTIRHSIISSNVVREVGNRLVDKPCITFDSNLRVKTKLTGLRSYPDCTVICGPLEYDDEDPARETVTNPTVLFEVLSPSTEAYDRGAKSESYRTMASLKAYVLIEQDKPHVEIYERQPGGAWLVRDISGSDSIIAIPSVGIELPMATIRARIDFSAPSLDSDKP